MAKNVPKQLLKKDGAEQYSDIHPKNYIQNITDAENGLSLEQYLEYPNVIHLENAVTRVGARIQVPPKMRRAKLILMYYAGVEVCEQFIGNTSDAKSSNWTNNNYWKDINIDTINADEEDLTEVDNKVKFKDNIYNPDEFSGLGLVYVRKYISNGKNLIYQGVFKYPNTRYIIRYDFDLDGNSIEIPDNCILDFQGGSIKNGYIKLNKARLLNTAFRGDYLQCDIDYDYALGQVLYIDNTYKYWNGSKWISFLTQDTSFVTVIDNAVVINTSDENNKVVDETLYLENSDINVGIVNETLILSRK